MCAGFVYLVEKISTQFVIDWRKSIRMQKYKIEKSEMPIIDEVILWLLRNAR